MFWEICGKQRWRALPGPAAVLPHICCTYSLQFSHMFTDPSCPSIARRNRRLAGFLAGGPPAENGRLAVRQPPGVRYAQLYVRTLLFVSLSTLPGGPEGVSGLSVSSLQKPGYWV